MDPSLLARVAPTSGSVIGGMLASKCAITQANHTYILKGSLFIFSCHRKLNLIWQKRVAKGPSSVQIHLRKAVIERLTPESGQSLQCTTDQQGTFRP